MGKLKKELTSHNVLYYLVIFSVMLLLIIGVLGGYLYQFYYKTLHADFMSGNAQYLMAIKDRHENDMQIVDNIVYQIGLSDDDTMFYLEKQPQKAIKLKEHLHRYTSVSQFFDCLIYYYHDDPYFYNYATSIYTKSFWENGCSFELASEEEFMELITAGTDKLRIMPEQSVVGDWISKYISGTEAILIIKTIPPEYKETLICFVPSGYYTKLLAGSEEELRSDFLYYDGQILLNRKSADIEELDLQKLIDDLDMNGCTRGGESYQDTVRVSGETYLLTMQKGNSGIIYGSLQSMEVFHDKMMNEQWSIIILLLVCAIPTTFVLAFLSGKIMRKVRRLNQLLNEEGNYGLDNIENGIQTLVRTHKEAEKENLPLKKTRFIRDFIRGGYAYRTDALVGAHKAGLYIDYEKYLVVLIRSREMNSENKAYAFMLDTIEKEESIEGYGVHMINNNQNLFVLFGNKEEEMEEILEKMLDIEKAYCQDYVMAISNYHTDIGESSKAYLEAETAFDNHLLTDNSKIIRFRDVAQKDYINLLQENYLQRLKYAIRASDNTAVEVAVKDICNKISGENVSLYTFRILYNDIIHVLLAEWTGDKSEFENFYSVFSLSQCYNMQDFNDLLCDVCKVIIDNRSGKEIKNSQIVEQAIAYMQEHFADPELTMNALADYLKVSSVTLAVEFKNEMDVRPSDYLSNLRMEKAKELLSTTNMLVREVSLAVGYEDDHVFTRRFKKYTGMTPGQYRG